MKQLGEIRQKAQNNDVKVRAEAASKLKTIILDIEFHGTNTTLGFGIGSSNQEVDTRELLIMTPP